MIEKYGFFDSVKGDERAYAEVDFARFGRVLSMDGVRGGEDALAVSAYAAGIAVEVDAGMAMVRGRYYALEDDGSGRKVLSLTAAAENPRIDRIVLRLTYGTRSIEVGVLTGTEAENPQPPALQRDTDVYMLSLASVYVGVGVTAIRAENITDERADDALCGIEVVSPDAAMREAQSAQKAAKAAQETADAGVSDAASAQQEAERANERLDGLKIGVAGGQEGNLVSLDADGNIVDSGKPVAKLGTGATYSLSGSTLYINTL